MLRQLLRAFLLVVLIGAGAIPVSAQETLIPNGASWRWRKGTNEVSNPTTLWRALGFNDTSWSTGNAPFHFGEGLAGGTLASDMRSNYTCVFLRTPFVITNVTEIAGVRMAVNYDDGFVAWINGTEVARVGVTNAFPFYTNTASISHEANTAQLIGVTNAPINYLVVGTNILAVQAFNQSLTSGDFRFETLLQLFTTNLVSPVVTNVSPAPSANLAALTQVTVSFSKPVYGVDAADLLINDVPAAALNGNAGTNRYTFTFTQPAPGLVGINWSDAPAITDVQGAPFNVTSTNANWTYTLTDGVAPLVTERTPVSGAVVSQLTQVELFFSEPVLGMNATDLLVNGSPASSVTGVEAGPYVFQFTQPNAGAVNFSWAGGHGITDLAANPFVATNWSLALNPDVAPGDVVINEFVVGNLSGPWDEDAERPDWIEIYNRGTNAVNLLGWSLTDNADAPGLWTFPSRVLNPGEYLLVFASGKDRRAPTGTNWLHTNFKLDLFGEYLALFNAESPRLAVSEFAADYPEQRNDYAYGLDASTNTWRYFQAPTPGAPNGSSAISCIAPPPHFSVERGFFDAPFNLLLTTTLPGATLRYTTDGSEPTLANGQSYVAPLAIASTTIIRAAAFADAYLPSRTRTHSYLYLDTVLTQGNNPPGFPSTWGTYASFTNNIVPADYEMDLDPLRIDPNDPGSPLDPEKLQRYHEGLRELPVVSISMSLDDIFNPSGLYHTPNVTSKSFPDQPCSVEMVLRDGTTAFAVSGGLSIHGNASREPRKNPKHGFKLSFKGEFGESSLQYRLFPDSPAEEFDDLIVRADFGSSWRHQSDTASEGLGAFQRTRATRTRDAWFKDTFRDMGQVASHNRYCHLFINGLYWGTYDFTEQANANFAPNYYGGQPEDFDVYEQGQLRSGTSTAYSAMTGITGLADNANYELMKQSLDVPQHIDSLVLHLFIGHQDWGGTKNWYAIRKRVSGPLGTFKYLPWDGENLLLDENVDRDKSPGGYGWPSGLHTKMVENAQYRLDFADRVHRHLIAPDGALAPDANIARWAKWMAVLDKPIVAESCRWGDYRRDVHNYTNFTSGEYVLYTRENQWLAESNRMVNSYLPNRNATVLAQCRRDGLYPTNDAPEYRQTTVAGPIIGSGAVAAGSVIALRNPGAGTVFYTTNGSDPRVVYSGVVAAAALSYSTPLTLNATVTLKARVLDGGYWSALNEASFTVGELGLPLRFTEIMYNPISGDAFEFIEIQNVGTGPLDIGGFSFDGLTFIIPDGTLLAPGGSLLLANNANPAQFAARYPTAVVSGYFSGNLANGGERIALLDRNLATIVAVHYDDEDGWLTPPDGGGYSLEVIDPRGEPNAAANWRASVAVNGTPGLAPATPSFGNVVINEVAADNAGSVTNGGLIPDWIELRNLGAPTNIAGWSLTDNSDARQFVFPANTIIPAGGFLVVWCDLATNAPGLHSGFALGRNGETISLFNTSTARVDAVTYSLQLTDRTVGRISGEWRLTLPTPNAANSAATVAPASELAVNEWLANPAPGGSDWLELFNRSFTAPVALRGIYLGTSNALSRYPSLSFIAPRGHVQLFAEELPGADQVEFKLPAEGSAIILFDPAGAELSRVTYGAQAMAISQGRLPDGTANLASFPGSVSPGASNYVLAYNGPVLNEVLARNDRAALAPWGRYADFVELLNASGSSVSLAGMAIGNSTDFGGAWKFPAGTSIAAGAHLLIWCDSARAASTSPAGPHNTGFALPGESGDVVLFNTAGQPVNTVSYGFQVEDQSIGRVAADWRLLATPTPGAANSAAAALGSLNNLRFNEWMPAPLAGDDWFELYNADPLPLNLSGLYLSDNPAVTSVTNSPIAPLSFIGGKKWVLFLADGNLENGRDHANFSLAQGGESLRLYQTNLTLIDVVDFGLQGAGVSQGLLPDGAPNYTSFPTTPSPDAANYLPFAGLLINEVLTHTDAPLEDAVELFNSTAAPLNIGGWYLSDSASDLKRYRIPDDTVVAAGDFKVLYQYQFGTTNTDNDTPPFFTFNSAHGDAVYLSEADAGQNLTGYRLGQSFAAAANGVSFGSYQTSVGVEFVALSQRTFGVDNPANLAQFRTGTGQTNAYPLVGPIIINEIMYHPPDHGTNSPDDEEYIELVNIGSSTVSLFDPAHRTNVWRLANAVSFDFATNQTLAVGASLLVVGFNPTNSALLSSFRARYGTNAAIVGPYSGQLNNAGETIELWRPDTPQAPPSPDAGFVPQLFVERVSYSDVAPWPVSADGGGFALRRIIAADYGNDPQNWTAALPTTGSTPPVPPVGTATLPGGGIVRLTFAVQPGLTYQVEYKNSLTNAVWLPLGAPVVAAGSPLVVDDSITGQPQRFYRLIGSP